MTAEHYHALHSWMDAHPAVSRCVVTLDRWLPLIPFVCYPVLLCLLNVRLFHLLGSQAALEMCIRDSRSYDMPFVPRRHGTLRLRLKGRGQITLRSIAKTMAAAKGGIAGGEV